VNREFLPSVSALLAFESAGRHNSITEAASELNLTQSAVSRQIRQLEDLLGVSLFRRSHQRVSLTETGRRYLKDVAGILQQLDSATRRAAMPVSPLSVGSPTTTGQPSEPSDLSDDELDQLTILLGKARRALQNRWVFRSDFQAEREAIHQ
jgi:DNA-binding transcriptional LysR family regulator